LIGCIVDDAVCGAIAARNDGKLMSDRWSNLILNWATRHYREYKRAPRKDIAGYFDRWAERNRDEEVSAAVERLLASLSGEYGRKVKAMSSAYLIDQSEEVFNKARLERLREEVAANVEAGDIAKAIAAVEGFRRAEVGVGAGIDIYKGGAAIRAAFADAGEVLVRWDQAALATFFGDFLARDEFVAILAGEKVGKSFLLQEISYQAVTQGQKVAFFEVGDQSERQIIRRFAARAANRPFKKDECYYYPTEMEAGEPPAVKRKRMSAAEPMTDDEADAAMRAVGKRYGRDSLRLSVHPSGSINVAGIAGIIERWRQDGWCPSTCIVDYADLLAPMDGRAETREQINQTWKALRRLNQELHCLMVTATQANAESYTATTLRKSNFSEDKRKFAHATAFFGINQTESEYERGLMRWNCLLARDGEFSSSKCVYVAPCLATANIAVHSTF
jgi:hypothetical protein